MVAIAQPSSPFTAQDYFDWEAQQELRYEYFDGQVYAMTGGSLAHGRIGLNISAILRTHSRSYGCLAFNSDCKVGLSEQGPFTYPDVSVSCDPRDRQATQFIQYPCLIIEVLSPSTEAYDRGGKFKLYRSLDSLQEYVLVGSVTKSIEVFRRNPSGSWEFRAYGEMDEATLSSVELNMPVSAAYEDVTLEDMTLEDKVQ